MFLSAAKGAGVPVRYYEKEHFDAYAQIQREGLEQWNDLHPADSGRGYDDFPSRSFLARILPADPGRRSSVLEYGCGTGGAACFLASRGYRLHSVDLVPDAIDLARQHAAQRGLSIRFVRMRLRPGGQYLISTAMYSPDRTYDEADHYDPATGIVWTQVPGPVEAATISGCWHVPNRRHLTAQGLRCELERHGFRLIEQSRLTGGDVVCEAA